MMNIRRRVDKTFTAWH